QVERLRDRRGELDILRRGVVATYRGERGGAHWLRRRRSGSRPCVKHRDPQHRGGSEPLSHPARLTEGAFTGSRAASRSTSSTIRSMAAAGSNPRYRLENSSAFAL